MNDFTHLNGRGEAVMVDVSGKKVTRRHALAKGEIRMSETCYLALKQGTLEKGDALAVARVAGIMAGKRTFEWIPLCHPLLLTSVEIAFAWLDESHALEVSCMVACEGQTGVEMEALTGASVALLTIYDMCKALDKALTISDIRLIEKHGGKSGDYERDTHD